MAKQISVQDALTTLMNAGITLTDEHKAKLAEISSAAMLGDAVTILAGDSTHVGKLIEKQKKFAEGYAKDLFAVAANVLENFEGEAVGMRGPGGGVRTVRRVTLETPSGVFKVELQGEKLDD